MQTLRRRHAPWLIRWIGVAMLWAALLPAWASVLRGSAGSGTWVEICTTTGPGWVQASTADAPTPDQPPPSMAAGASCPYCLLQHAAWAPPPAAVQWHGPRPFLKPAPVPALATQADALAWPRALPRAPPRHG